MTQKEYLEALEEALSGLDPKDKDELMADFKEHFDIGHSEGKTEQEIIDHLGSVKDLVESLDLKRLESQNATSSDHNKTFNEQVDRLVVEGLHADVTIVASDDEQTHVDYEISRSLLGKLSTEVTTKQEGKSLFVTVTSVIKFFKNSLDPVDLTIQIPKLMREVICKTVSGDIKLDDLTIESLELHSVSGDIGVDEVKTQKTKVVGVSSDLNLSDVSGDLQLKTVTGDVEIEDHDGSALSIETVSGDIEYEGSATEIRANTTSGDGCFKAASIQNLSANTVSGDYELQLGIENKGLTIAFISNSGELRIGDAHYDTPRHNQSITIGDGQIKVYLKSISGDFVIE